MNDFWELEESTDLIEKEEDSGNIILESESMDNGTRSTSISGKQDVLLEQDTYGKFDISFENGDLKKTSGLETALDVSIYTDARASSDLVPIPENQRGWLGNIVSPVTDRQLGGLLWLIDQRRLTQNTLNTAVDYARKSLNWLIKDQVAKNIEVTGEIVPRFGIELKIILTAINGQTETRFYKLWEVTGIAN
jgi:phage gp46-like protein